jgi:hypothetical protein
MANVNNFPTVSDGLAAIIRALEPNRKTGIVMVKRDVATFLEGLQALHDAARIVETIADRAQWNEAARRDGVGVQREVLEAAIADGSVSLFPVVPRPMASRQGDGRDGAA